MLLKIEVITEVALIYCVMFYALTKYNPMCKWLIETLFILALFLKQSAQKASNLKTKQSPF